MSNELSVALANSELLFDEEAIDDAVEGIAALIRADYAEGERPVYLTLMHGGMLFASNLSLSVGIDLEFDYLHATRYRGALTGSGLAWLHRPATALEGRRVLIADDILDEGHTLKAVRDWCEDQGAAEVKIAVLCVKNHDRRVEGIDADYIALEVPDAYVYGYGMDYHEQGRNLPGIYALSLDLAVIGGTGVYRIAALQDEQVSEGDTIYGSPSAPVRIGTLSGRRVAFLARHGEGHSVAPHRINYRANLRRLADLGIRRVLAINTVGGITPRFAPRTLAVPDQLIDYTWGRIATICEEPGTPVLHVDFGDPYCEPLRQAVLAAGRKAAVALVEGGCYGATQGPRLETRAEIARMRRDGCDLVGMTGMPEAGLAREMGLDYACLAISANWAAGCGAEPGAPAAEITLDEVLANVDVAAAGLPRLLGALLEG